MLVTSYVRNKQDTSLHHELAKRLVSKGIDVEVVCPHDEKDSKGFEEIDGVKIHRFQYFWPKKLQKVAYHGGMTFNLRRCWLAKLQFPFFLFFYFLKAASVCYKSDIIHAQWVLSGLIAMPLKWFYKKQMLLSIHSLVVKNFLTKIISKFVLGQADFVVFNSSYTLNVALNLSKIKNYCIIHPSLDENIFSPKSKPLMKKKVGIQKETKIVLSVGRFIEVKGLNYFIKAVNHIPKELNVVFVLIGFGPLEKELKALIKKEALTNRFVFVGKINNLELPQWIVDANIFVVPSVNVLHGETESFGIVAMEASACGIPVIASNIGGLPDIVEDNKTGFLVEEKNEKQIAEKIIFLLKNPAIAKKLGKNARKKVEEKFTWAKAVNDFLNVLNQLRI